MSNFEYDGTQFGQAQTVAEPPRRERRHPRWYQAPQILILLIVVDLATILLLGAAAFANNRNIAKLQIRTDEQHYTDVRQDREYGEALRNIRESIVRMDDKLDRLIERPPFEAGDH